MLGSPVAFLAPCVCTSKLANKFCYKFHHFSLSLSLSLSDNFFLKFNSIEYICTEPLSTRGQQCVELLGASSWCERCHSVRASHQQAAYVSIRQQPTSRTQRPQTNEREKEFV